MFTKTLLATSALVVASSLAVASPVHPTHRSLATIKQEQRTALINKGIVVNQKGFQLGVRMVGKPVGEGKLAKYTPGSAYSNFSKETNALFISWFGWFAGAANPHSAFSGSFCEQYSGSKCINHYKYKDSFSEHINQSAAQPFTAAASATAKGLSIGAEQYSGTGGATIGLYSNTGTCANSATTACPGAALAHGSFSTAVAFTGACCSGLDSVKIHKTALKAGTQYWVVVSQNGSNEGRVAWNGQASNWTSFPAGEDYKYAYTEKIDDTYHTTASGGHSTYKTTLSGSSNGWIHTNSLSYGEQSGAFLVK